MKARALEARAEETAPLATIDDRSLAGVHGGAPEGGGVDWVDIGGGFATGFCALGPLVGRLFSRIRYVV